MAVPANGLSVTQRRILTMLDTPGRLGDLSLGPSIDTQRLRREAQRLTQAGLIACETSVRSGSPVAANAPVLAQSAGSPVARAVPLALVTIASVGLVWVGWRLTATPAPLADGARHAGSASQTAASRISAPAPVGAPDPGVIATRVLRSDPGDRNRDAAKDSHGSAALKAVAAPAPPGADIAHAPVTEARPARVPAADVGRASSLESTSNRTPSAGSEIARESASLRAPAVMNNASSDPALGDPTPDHEIRTESGAAVSLHDP